MTMRAQYRTECQACLEDINVGDLIKQSREGTDLSWVHDACPAPAKVTEQTVCPECWEFRSKTGTCACP
jgi:hypothetical protein